MHLTQHTCTSQPIRRDFHAKCFLSSSKKIVGLLSFTFTMSNYSYLPLFVCKSSSAQGVLAMFAYGGVRGMFLGLKFHLKAIFWGSNICNMNSPILGDKKYGNQAYLSDPQRLSLSGSLWVTESRRQSLPIFPLCFQLVSHDLSWSFSKL